MRFRSIIFLCLGGTFSLASVALCQDEHLPDGDLYEDGHGPFNNGSTGAIESGFVFIDGEFVAAPYDVRMSGDGQEILINDRAVPGAVPQRRPRSQSGEPPYRGRDGANRRVSDWPPRSMIRPPGTWARRIREHLESNNAVVAFTDQQMRLLTEGKTYSLLKTLQDFDIHSDGYRLIMEVPHGPQAVGVWEQWLQDFTPDEAFRSQVEPFLEWLDTAESKNHSAAAAVRRFDAVAYPLTLAGMLLSVIAFGHLLMSLPNSEAMRRGSAGGAVNGGLPGEVIKATMTSLALVAILSSLDLTWTILAAQAGQMRELNPIASHFINDPLALIAFKSSATLLGCGLLFLLRRHSRAQIASWWMCLVLTMLTFRWLMFNSMFVT